MRNILLGSLLACSVSAFAIPGHVTKPLIHGPVQGVDRISDGTSVGPAMDIKPVSADAPSADEVLVRVHLETGVVEVNEGSTWEPMEIIRAGDDRLADIGTSMSPGGGLQKVQYYPGYQQPYAHPYHNPCAQGCAQPYVNPCANGCGQQFANPCQYNNPCDQRVYQVPQPYYQQAPPAYYARPYAPQVAPYVAPYYNNQGVYGRRPVILARPYGAYRRGPYVVNRYPRRW